MKLIKNASKTSLSIDRAEWISVGLSAGWLCKAENQNLPPAGLPSVEDFFGKDLAPDPWIYFREVLTNQNDRSLIEAGVQYLEHYFQMNDLRQQLFSNIETALVEKVETGEMTPDKQSKTLKVWSDMLFKGQQVQMKVPEQDFQLSEEEFASKGEVERLRNEMLDLFNSGKIDRNQLQNRLNELAKSKPTLTVQANKQIVKFDRFSWLVTGLKCGYIVAQMAPAAPPTTKPTTKPDVAPTPEKPKKRDPFQPRVPKELPKPKATKPVLKTP